MLVSTMPVDRLVAAIDDCPSEIREAAASLEHNGVWVLGVGVNAASPTTAPGSTSPTTQSRSTESRTSPSTRRRTSRGGHRALLVVPDRDGVLSHRRGEPEGLPQWVLDGLVEAD